jgi:hypothetical protein
MPNVVQLHAGARMARAREETFAEFLRRYMKENHFTPVDVAFFARASEKAVHQWKRDRKPGEKEMEPFKQRALREHLEQHCDQFKNIQLAMDKLKRGTV